MKGLFSKFKRNWDLRQEILVFGEYLKNPVWVILSRVPSSYTQLKETKVAECVRKSTSSAQAKDDLAKILTKLKECQEKRTLVSFKYGRKTYGICYPLKSNGDTFGFIVLCGLTKQMHPEISKVFAAYTDTVIRESEKELELEEIFSQE